MRGLDGGRVSHGDSDNGGECLKRTVIFPAGSAGRAVVILLMTPRDDDEGRQRMIYASSNLFPRVADLSRLAGVSRR